MWTICVTVKPHSSSPTANVSCAMASCAENAHTAISSKANHFFIVYLLFEWFDPQPHQLLRAYAPSFAVRCAS